MNESPESVLTSLAAAWQSADAERIRRDIDKLYADNAVIAIVDGTRTAKGRAAIVDSYVTFARDAKLVDSRVQEAVIDRFDAVAVATVKWSMTYEFGGTRSSETGRDVYVLNRCGEYWKICWRECAPDVVHA